MTFEHFTREPLTDPVHAYVRMTFLRPDGDGEFTSVYDLLSPVDVATVNRNLADGYRLVSLSA